MSKKPEGPLMLPPGSRAYTVVLTAEKVKENDFTPPKTIYSAMLFHNKALVDGVSGGLSPMIAKSLDKETRKKREMEAYGQVIGALAKVLIADSADTIVGDR